MARPFAIPAVGKAILSLLSAGVPKPEFANAVFELVQPKDLQTPIDEGIGLYLYRITAASKVTSPPPHTTGGRQSLPPLHIDLHYLLVAWARDAFKQQRLLGWAMRTLDSTPVLPASLLNAEEPEPDLFDENEAVEVVLETISLEDLGTIWEGAGMPMQPGAAYVARGLSIQ